MNAAPHGASVNKSAESLAKKRARDRRAQQNQRDKRNEQVRSLQAQLTRMESRMLQLTRECQALRHENGRLRGRQDAVARLVASWGEGGREWRADDDGSDPVLDSPPCRGGGEMLLEEGQQDGGAACGVEPPLAAEEGALGEREGSSSSAVSVAKRETAPPPAQMQIPGLEFWSQWGTIPSSSGSAPPPPPPPPPPAAVPPFLSTSTSTSSSSIPASLPFARRPWADIPAHLPTDVVVTGSFNDWLQRPDLARSSPDDPLPTELLYGSRTNFLANVINRSLRAWPCRDPERLASGWLVYNKIKWMLAPGPAAYARLQPFQVPVPEQLDASRGHPYFVDFVHWPELRARMVRHADVYSPRDVLGMYLCCVKLRWPWGQNFLEPRDDGTLRMRQDYLETITSLDGWGLTDDFIQRFPLLTQGLNLSAMRFRLVC